MVGIGEQAATVVEQDFLDQAGIACWRIQYGDGEVDVAQAQCTHKLLGNAADYGQMHGIAAARELRASGRKHATEKSRTARDPDGDVTCETVEERNAVVFEVSPLRENSLGAQVDGLAERSGGDAFGSPLQQRRPEVGLELMDALAQSGLGNAQAFGSLAETAAVDCGHEAFQLAEIHEGLTGSYGSGRRRY